MPTLPEWGKNLFFETDRYVLNAFIVYKYV